MHVRGVEVVGDGGGYLSSPFPPTCLVQGQYCTHTKIDMDLLLHRALCIYLVFFSIIFVKTVARYLKLDKCSDRS